jgi:hypothetical protein
MYSAIPQRLLTTSTMMIQGDILYARIHIFKGMIRRLITTIYLPALVPIMR